jgi:hypothetical protein
LPPGRTAFCTLAAVTLRAAPVVEHASLPGGGSVEVWVGVPEDSYIPRAQSTTVDLQLREGASVLATVTTVLEPEQTSEARQLAREVCEAIEAERIPLTASALEPFADQLR